MMGQGSAGAAKSQVDWRQALRFFKTTLGVLVGRADADLIDSLASDAALRLVRVSRRERIHNQQAMMNVICHRVYQDWKRKLYTEAPVVSIDGSDGEGLDIPEPSPGRTAADIELASFEWMTFKALEMVELVAGPDCRQYLKAYYLELKDHAAIAGRLGIDTATGRKRKSRCEERLTSWIGENPAHPMTVELRGFLDRFER